MVTTRHRTVFVRVPDGDDAEMGVMCFGPEEMNLPDEELDKLLEEGEVDAKAIFIPDSLHQEMGCPNVITVTVEPGDLLNNTLPEAPRLDG